MKTITKAAVRHRGKIYTGERHGIIMQQIWEETGVPEKIPQDEQGFVTSDGRFVNRWQAGSIAFTAGQTKTRHQHLLSEHLW